eukprot:16452365-Heterocapsa_arctica.AAC.1
MQSGESARARSVQQLVARGLRELVSPDVPPPQTGQPPQRICALPNACVEGAAVQKHENKMGDTPTLVAARPEGRASRARCLHILPDGGRALLAQPPGLDRRPAGVKSLRHSSSAISGNGRSPFQAGAVPRRHFARLADRGACSGSDELDSATVDFPPCRGQPCIPSGPGTGGEHLLSVGAALNPGWALGLAGLGHSLPGAGEVAALALRAVFFVNKEVSSLLPLEAKGLWLKHVLEDPSDELALLMATRLSAELSPTRGASAFLPAVCAGRHTRVGMDSMPCPFGVLLPLQHVVHRLRERAELALDVMDSGWRPPSGLDQGSRGRLGP